MTWANKLSTLTTQGRGEFLRRPLAKNILTTQMKNLESNKRNYRSRKHDCRPSKIKISKVKLNRRPGIANVRNDNSDDHKK